MLTYITPPYRKAFALQATMYKGFVANGTTLIIELYETNHHLPDHHW